MQKWPFELAMHKTRHKLAKTRVNFSNSVACEGRGIESLSLRPAGLHTTALWRVASVIVRTAVDHVSVGRKCRRLPYDPHTRIHDFIRSISYWKDTVLSRGVRSLFGHTRKSSPWGNFSDGGLNQSIKRRLSLSASTIDWFIGFVSHDLFLRGRG